MTETNNSAPKTEPEAGPSRTEETTGNGKKLDKSKIQIIPFTFFLLLIIL